ncbi:c-type cytochrome [Frateuria hangzhouensis]|uniref:c-type cytochrome n=1 Tax=Frateuria hangzhouensis TaxID=2995589 RepID=UPI002260B0F9|nr:cytochrome c [Frateuria sp. STR12]MCX7513267.1 cytochrome c [Frateuria sp. STR12]
MGLRRSLALAGLLLAAVLCSACSPDREPAAPSTVKLGQRMSAGPWGDISRGRYLVHAGDCKACHTAPGGAPFAGDRAIPTPFGTIYSSNITPDPETGIGRWTDEDFYRAMHEGIDRLGNHLYPAFPYPWYTRMSRDDVRAIKAYLDTLAPVRQNHRENELPWPLGQRGVLAVWNGMFFDEGTYRPDPDRSAQWNRGAYLVKGPGHCGACHSDKNLAGATDEDDPLTGGFAEHAFAPNLAGGIRDGLGTWTGQDIVQYLRTGRNGRTAAAGPMAEVIEQSTQYLSKPDLEAIAVYLKSLPATKDASVASVDKDTLGRGAALYVDNCAGCHLGEGQGELGAFPPLRKSTAVQAQSADTLIGVILNGARIPRTEAEPTGLAMQGFADHLDDAQIATLTTYIRNAWGNHAEAVDAGHVEDLRETLRKSPDG